MSNFATLPKTNAVTPGHSAVAFVSEADEDSGLKLGSRVVISPYITQKEHGIDVVKTMGVDIDGLLSDFVCLPYENVFALPDGVSDEDAMFAEYIAMGNNVFEALDCEKGDYVVIVGASTLGLIISQLALYYQIVPILIDMDAEKLALAQKWGVAYTLNPTFDNLERRVEEITGGAKARFSRGKAWISIPQFVSSKTRETSSLRVTQLAQSTPLTRILSSKSNSNSKAFATVTVKCRRQSTL